MEPCYFNDFNELIFNEDNTIRFGQDFSFWEGVPADIPFTIARLNEEKIALTAIGYGVLDGQNHYGNGALFVGLYQLPLNIQNKCKEIFEKREEEKDIYKKAINDILED